MKKPCSEMFCLRNQDITDAKAFFYLFFMSNSGYLSIYPYIEMGTQALWLRDPEKHDFIEQLDHFIRK